MESQTQTRPHVVVVGAGIVGASIAWHLVRHPSSPSVTIVADDVGGTATPNSFAWLNASWHNPRFYYDFRRRSLAGWKRMADELPALQGELLRWCGSLTWDMTPDKLEAYLREHASWGYDIRRVERAEIQALEPALASDGDFLPEWGLHVREEGAVEATAAARLLVADAQARGARLTSATATAVVCDPSGNGIRGIATLDGEDEVRADHVVLAAGAGCAALGASAGIAVPLGSRPRPGLLVHSKPVGRRILNGVVCSQNGHMRQTAEGRIVAGADFAGGDPGPDPGAAATRLFDRMRTSFRPADGELLELDYFTVGYRPTPEDGLPILGATGLKGLSIAVMHSGVTNAAIVGELLAESILTGKEDPCLAHFALKRFRTS